MSQISWPDGKTAAAAFTFDVDAESAVLWNNEAVGARMSVMSHQAYGPLVGIPRILELLERHQIASTFFVPGHTADRYPQAIRSIVAAGHEIAHHGYLHEQPTQLTLEQEIDVIDRGLAALADIAGVTPAGYRAPMWDLSWRTPALLAERGFLYDSSLMDSDHPYELAITPGAQRVAGRDPDPVGARRLGAVLLSARHLRQRTDREPAQGPRTVATGVRRAASGRRLLGADQPSVPVRAAFACRRTRRPDALCARP